MAAPEAVQHAETSNWFIILICLILLLLFALLVFFLVWLNRGGVYPVHDKERKHGTVSGPLEEEKNFCEFVRRFVLSCSVGLLLFIEVTVVMLDYYP